MIRLQAFLLREHIVTKLCCRVALDTFWSHKDFLLIHDTGGWGRKDCCFDWWQGPSKSIPSLKFSCHQVVYPILVDDIFCHGAYYPQNYSYHQSRNEYHHRILSSLPRKWAQALIPTDADKLARRWLDIVLVPTNPKECLQTPESTSHSSPQAKTISSKAQEILLKHGLLMIASYNAKAFI